MEVRDELRKDAELLARTHMTQDAPLQDLVAQREQSSSVEYSVLGRAGRDNALFVRLNTGQKIIRLLFDCGADCLNDLPMAEVQAIDAVCFSHFHIDHIAGFDHLLRSTFDREDKPVAIFGPPDTARIISHRLQGVQWDRVEGSRGRFEVTEVHAGGLRTFEMRSEEGFGALHEAEPKDFSGILIDLPEAGVECVILDHGTPVLGYLVRLKTRWAVDPERLKSTGLRPGPWLKIVKDASVGPEGMVTVDSRQFSVGDLRSQLLMEKPGESLGYLTDFRITPETGDELIHRFHGCRTLLCENNFSDLDLDQAKRTFHMTSTEVAMLVEKIGPERLVLFHLSDRYTVGEWRELIGRIRNRFRPTYFPYEWRALFEV